jgi:aspartate racemase
VGALITHSLGFFGLHGSRLALLRLLRRRRGKSGTAGDGLLRDRNGDDVGKWRDTLVANAVETGRRAGIGLLVKTIGVLGGIGPQATMDFERRVHDVARQLIPPHFNAGYPPMVVWYCRHPPVVVRDDGSADLPVRADPRFLEAAARLGAVCDFLVMPSNGAHALQAEVERASGRRVVSIIDATLAEVRRRAWRRAGVMTLGDPGIYTRPLEQAGVSCQTLNEAAHKPLARGIFRVMEARNDATDAAAASAAVADLRRHGVDGVILGCTEIPFLVDASAPDLLNPAQLLADAAVRAALEP